MYTSIAMNPLRTLLGLNREKNKNIKASPKKRSSYKSVVPELLTEVERKMIFHLGKHI